MIRPRRPVSEIRLLQLTVFVPTFDRFAMPPMLLAISADLGSPLSQVVQAAGAYFLAYGLSQPVWGMVSDWLGLVRTMRLTLVAAAIATAAAALTWDPLSLGAARGLAGACFGAAFPSSLIYIGDMVSADRRHREITRLMVGVALGIALASVTAGVVADLVSWRAMFVATGVAAALLAHMLGSLPASSVHRTHATVWAPMLQVLRSPAAMLVLALVFTEGATLLGVLTLLPPAIEATGSSASVAGSVAAVYGVSVYAFARLVGELSLRYHPSRLIALGGVAGLTACSLVALSQLPAAAVMAAALLGLAWTGMHSSLQTWATEVLPAARATIVSLFAGSLFVGSAVAAVLAAGPAEDGDYGIIFAVAAALLLPLTVTATWARARWRPRP